MSDIIAVQQIVEAISFKEKLIELTGRELILLRADLTTILAGGSLTPPSPTIAAKEAPSPSQPTSEAPKRQMMSQRTMAAAIKEAYVLELDDLPNELWRPIPHYPDYKLSNKGRVKSLPRTRETAGGTRHYRERILKPQHNGHLNLVNSDGMKPVSVPSLMREVWKIGEWCGPL